MSNIKTILLTGDEQEVQVSGMNCDIRNDGVDTVYASRRVGITAGADGVLSIPAGQAAKLLDTGGTVYLKGTGSVQLCGNDYHEQVFKCAASASGGSGSAVDQTARDAINAHANNGDIHLTAADVAAIASNDNALINSNFRINQRGMSEHIGVGFCVDCWKTVTQDSLVALTDNGLKVGFDPSITLNDSTSVIKQVVENYYDYKGRQVTVSINVAEKQGSTASVIIHAVEDGSYTVAGYASLSVGDNYCTGLIPNNAEGVEIWIYGADSRRGDTTSSYTLFKHAKMELGDVPTAYAPPDPATELVRCQRYYQVRSTGDIKAVDMRPSMGNIIDVAERSDGNYEYIAE